MNKNKWAVFQSIWFCWFILTALYIILNIAGYPNTVPSTMGYIAGFIGLFVPYGLPSLILMITPYSWVSLAVFHLAMFWINRRLKGKNLGLGKRIVLNLLALLILTIIVDLIRLTPFESWRIFFNGAMRNYFDMS